MTKEGTETDLKPDKKQKIDKVEKKTYEVFINITKIEHGQGQGNEDPEDDEEQPEMNKFTLILRRKMMNTSRCRSSPMIN